MAWSSSWQSKAATAAIWDRVGAAMKKFWASRRTGSTRSPGATTQPSRHPVIEKYFEKLLTTRASRLRFSAVGAGAPKVMPW